MKTLRHFEKSFLLCAALGILGDLTVQAQAAVEAWAQRYDGSAFVVLHGGWGEKLVVDSSGDVIVAGFTGSEDHVGYDGLLIKYSDTGVPLWTNRYGVTGISFADHRTIAVATDGNDNVFVAGDLNLTNGNVFATFKYSGTGIPLWTNLGPGGSASAVATDGSGNVFVLGLVQGTNGWLGSAIVKYSGAGVVMWTNLFNDGTGDYATATDFSVDGGGNVFVTGYYSRTNGYNQAATIKYSGAGLSLWTNHGPGGIANAVATDGSGNVYVTGWSYRSNGSEYATIKYSGEGLPLWTNRYNEPGISSAEAIDLAVDTGGNIFVTGNLYGNIYATIGYSSTGVSLWTNRYNGNEFYHGANAVAVDGNGNVVVTGYPTTIKYSGAGIPLWTNGGGSAIAVDGSANVFVTGNGAMAIAYSSTGMPLWTNNYIASGIGGDDHARSVAVDGAGNVFVTGDSFVTRNSYATDGTYGYATIKYSGTGVALWTNRGPGGSGGSDLSARALALDGSGNVFVTGAAYGANGLDYATLKYSEAGVPLWTNRYNATGSGDNRANALAVDGSGNVIVTGYSDGVGTSGDYATIKYSGAGVPLWTHRYGGSGWDAATALAVDGSGNVIVTGHSYINGYDYATLKYSDAGVPMWTNRYNGAGNYDDYAAAVAVDASGNVVVTGYSYGNGYDYATIKYSAPGLPLWTNRYSAPGNGNDQATALALDSSGNVVVTGNSSGDCVTIKYSGAGVPLWTNRYSGGYATSLAVDGSGNVFVTGYVTSSDGSYDYLTIKYSPAGLPLLTITRTAINTVAVSWPSPSTGFTLHQNTDLTTTNWAPVGTTPLDDGITKTVIVNPPVGNRFYRLVHP